MATEDRVEAVRARLRDSQEQLRSAEEALRRHAERLDEAQAIAHLGSWDWDVRTDVVTWSDEMFRICGLEPQSCPVDYTRFLDAVHPADRERVDQGVQRAFATGSSFAFEHRIIRPNGEERLVLARGRAIADETGAVARMTGTGHDVTEQRQAEDRAAVAATAIGMAQRVADLQLITETALAHLSLDELLPELLQRIAQALGVQDAAVFLTEDDHETLVLRAVHGLAADEVGFRVAAGDGFAGRVAAERAPLVLAERAHQHVLSPALREARVESIIGVPLLLAGDLLGVIQVGSLQPRRFQGDEIALVELAAERAAMAIDHARVYERERSASETLQRALLPAKLPELETVTAAARYIPASDDMEVGGDWYDVIPLANGEVGVALGDVTGHGVEAATLMAQVRHGLRAYALDNPDPGAIVDRLDTLIHSPGMERLATLVYAVIAPDLSMRFVNAGHLPPLVVSADRNTRLLDVRSGLPVGFRDAKGYVTQTDRLAPGDTLVLYTDGLVERRGELIDDGIARLRMVAAAGPDDPHNLADHILRELLPGAGRGDDIALLTVRPRAVRAATS